MASFGAGAIAAADINAQPSSNKGMLASAPATWATIWFIIATLYLVGIYYGMIRIHASAS